MKDLVKDPDGKVDAAKIAFWITLFSCLTKMFMEESPDYAGLAIMGYF